MSEEQIKVGDVVQLRSGGPLMTVQKVSNYQRTGPGALCLWFDDKDQKEHVFGLQTLKVSDPGN